MSHTRKSESTSVREGIVKVCPALVQVAKSLDMNTKTDGLARHYCTQLKKRYCVEHSYRYLLHVCASPQHTALHDIARCRAAEVLPSGNQTWQWKSHANPSFTDDFPSNSNPVYIQVGLWIAMFDYHQRNYIYIYKYLYIHIYIYVCVCTTVAWSKPHPKKRMAGFAPEIHIRRSDLPLSFGDTTQCLG